LQCSSTTFNVHEHISKEKRNFLVDHYRFLFSFFYLIKKKKNRLSKRRKIFF